MLAKYALAIIIVLALSIQCVIGTVVNRCDINQDGIINIQDLVLVADNSRLRHYITSILSETVTRVC